MSLATDVYPFSCPHEMMVIKLSLKIHPVDFAVNRTAAEIHRFLETGYSVWNAPSGIKRIMFVQEAVKNSFAGSAYSPCVNIITCVTEAQFLISELQFWLSHAPKRLVLSTLKPVGQEDNVDLLHNSRKYLRLESNHDRKIVYILLGKFRPYQ